MLDIYEILWLAAVIVFVVIEALTLPMVCIWFAAASLAALISALLGAPVWLQFTIFSLCSVALLIFTRPIVKRLTKKPRTRTNADRIIDKVSIVIEEINNDKAEGLVNIGGQLWSARSKDSCIIPAGTKVLIRSIEGNKVMVEDIHEAAIEK